MRLFTTVTFLAVALLSSAVFATDWGFDNIEYQAEEDFPQDVFLGAMTLSQQYCDPVTGACYPISTVNESFVSNSTVGETYVFPESTAASGSGSILTTSNGGMFRILSRNRVSGTVTAQCVRCGRVSARCAQCGNGRQVTRVRAVVAASRANLRTAWQQRPGLFGWRLR